MIFAITTLISALSISLIAAYFSIIGLATIFPGSMYAVIAMGSVLEIGKIIASIWLHKNWKSAPKMIKFYLFSAIIVLMGITSMGIFGFLSKSHIEHEQTAEKSKALLEQVENKITRQRDYIQRQKDLITKKEEKFQNLGGKTSENIKLEQEKISQLTNQLDRDISIDNEILKSLNDKISLLDKDLNNLKNKSGSLFSSKKKDIEVKILEQKSERESIAKIIKTAEDNISKQRAETSEIISSIRKRIQEYQSLGFEKPGESESRVELFNQNISKALDAIDTLEQEKFNYSDGTRQLEAEIGPIKYVAEFISDLTGSSFDVSKAVRIVILILIFVFDPLAILLVLAAHISLSKKFPGAMQDESIIFEKMAQAEANQKALELQILDTSERKKDLDQELKMIELNENQAQKYQEEIIEHKETLRNLKIEAQKEILKKEDASEIIEEIEKLMVQKKSAEEEISEIKIKKNGILNKAEETIKSAKEIREIFIKHGQEKKEIEELRSAICINQSQFQAIKNQIQTLEAEKAKLSSENVELKNREAPNPNPDLEKRIKELTSNKNKLLEENLKIKSQKKFVIKLESLPKMRAKMTIPGESGGEHEYSRAGQFSNEEVCKFIEISRQLSSIENDGEKARLFESLTKGSIDPKLSNREYNKLKTDYKFIP